MSPKMVEAESVGSNTDNCKRRLFTESSNSDTEAWGSCNLEPVKRPRKVLKKMAGSSQAECFCTIPKIPSFTHEIASSISISGSSRKRSYETISSRSISLAEEVADILNSMADSGHITPSKADDAAVYSNLLKNRIQVLRFCMMEGIEEKVAHLEFIITRYGERFLRRSYETISSRSISLAEQVADILNSMADSGHITPSKANEATAIYSNLLNNGLEVVVQMFCRTESIEKKIAHLEHIITKFGEHFL